MSYILDALRKSEQERQATQPENVTDRILANPPQPKPKHPKWLAALIVGNILLIAALIWYFNHKSPPTIQQKQTVALEKQMPPQAAELQRTDQEQPAKAQSHLPPSVASAATAAPQPASSSTSIAEMIEHNKPVEAPKPVKKVQEKKPQPVKKEQVAKATAVHKAVPHHSIPEPGYEALEVPVTQRKSTGTPDLNELSYEVRNNLPNLNINVFSYNQQPEDRFVIIDMVKYKTGQLVKGKVKLKEIRPDSIVMENNDGSTFKVERP